VNTVMNLRVLSMGVKRAEREADRSPQSGAEVKHAWSYTSTPPIRLHGVVLSYAQGHFYLYLFIMISRAAVAQSV